MTVDIAEENPTEAFLRILVEPIQEAQNAIQQLKLLRAIATATGWQLDVLGKIVGQKRNGLGDDDYRRFIRAKILVNRSSGTIDQLIKIARLIVDDGAATFRVINWGTACVTMSVRGISMSYALASVLVAMLRKAVAAGVRLIVEFHSSTPRFKFKTFSGSPGTGDGFASVSLGISGGKLGSVIE